MEFLFSDESNLFHVDFQRMQTALERVFYDAGKTEGAIELVVLDPEPMRAVNVQFLGHDYATDVLAFRLDDADASERLDATIAICAEVAAELAPKYRWSRENELLLYAVHGALHLVGYDDHTPEGAVVMRAKEREYLESVGVDASRYREGEE